MGYNMVMETRATVSRLDLICETLGVSLETLAKRARVAPEDLYMARDERWHPATLIRLSEHLGIPLSIFDIPTTHLAELLKAFSVVEPSHRLTLIDKIWTMETVLRAVLKSRVLSSPKSLRLDDMLEAFENQRETGHRSFVAFVRQQLEDSKVLVFSHPFGDSDYTAILFVPHERSSAFKYLVVNENEWLSPLTNALFQWYEVLRLLSRWDNTDDENGFSVNPEASWTAIYLERIVDGYCPHLNKQLRNYFISNYHISDVLSTDQYRWYSILTALMEGLPPAVVAELLSHAVRIDGEEGVDEIIHSLRQPDVINKIVSHLMIHRMFPTGYDWTVPSYPPLVMREALYAVPQRCIPRHITLSVLSIPDYEYDILLENMKLLHTHGLST
jgi:hypothetical protein